MFTSVSTEGTANNPPLLLRFIGWVVPNGWFDMTKTRGVSLYFQAARESVDPVKKRVYPEKANQLKSQVQSLGGYDMPDLLLRVSAPPVIGSVSAFAEVQSRVDAAYIACALERYHLAHGTYPDSLDALSPYAPQGLPHDLMSGDAYHYKLQTDGTYLLYSVGWDQVDDGGKVAYKSNDAHSLNRELDREHGDWVWPWPKGN